MPADPPFNLDDLDPDARAMAEAAAQAAGMSLSEWVSRVVLARAGTPAPARALPAQEPPPVEPPAPEPAPDAPAGDIDGAARIVPLRADGDAFGDGQLAPVERESGPPPDAILPDAMPGDAILPDAILPDAMPGDAAPADRPAEDAKPAAYRAPAATPAARLHASSAITVLRAAPDDGAPHLTGTAPPGAPEQRVHASLSVGTDSSTIVIKRPTAKARPKPHGAAPAQPAAEQPTAAEAGARVAPPARVVDMERPPVSGAEAGSQDDANAFFSGPLSAPENEEPLQEADRGMPPTFPEQAAADAITDGAAADEPPDPSLAAASPAPISDLGDFAVDADSDGDIGGKYLPSRRRRVLLLGSVALSLVAAATWFSLAPVFQTGDEAPFDLPSLLSALRVSVEERFSPSPPDEPAASPPALDAPPAESAEPSAALAETSDTPAEPSAAVADPSQQLAALKQLAEKGERMAQHDLAVRYARGDGAAQDYREAARWFRAAALQGVANAQYNIGVLTERGLGVEANPPMALLWYLAAAAKGHSAAEYNIGLIYAEGKGVDVNPAESMKWFQRSAERGFTRAQYNLGVMYERGVENRIDLIEAYRWYRIAATGGDSGAEQRLSEIKERMSPVEIAKAEELARQPLVPPTP